MREITGEMVVYESLLNLYYDEMAKYYLNKELISVVDSFVMYCKAKDIVDNTNIAETMEIVYNSHNKMSKGELKKRLSLSDSSLYRFRIKLVRSLNKYISDQLGEK